jgi:undecaprenyl-phosphate 4-deoxy-4-formamido-L-arabinose transferase
MDDDLQHDPEDILLLYETCKNGDYDVCYGKFSLRYHSFWKRVGSFVNGRIARWLLKKPKALYLSPYKIITKEVVQEIVRYEGPFPYVDGLLLQLTSSITQIDVRCHPRKKGKSTYSFLKSLSLFLRHTTSFSVIPIRIATVTGFIMALAGFGLAIYYLCEYFFGDHSVEGWTSLIVSLLFLGGLILMSLGLIGEYIGRSFLTINKKPQRSVRKIIKPISHDSI